ncbi:helix-turn-helix domain-containing protein [Pseudomonas sp.]|uniref:helix-turn-helix domain-containing protein n=1 Tax=Pseudomonas sp. TaxID=306 RepID=UPI0024BC18C8|nr:helix-turn-helix domain-containing protein [Pseudomonas sp.]MDI9778602.1 helix-turn-helix domain-containing protein [Pseudomonas putida]
MLKVFKPKAACGRSVQDVIQSVRLEKARRLLAGSRLSVDDIASQIGYRDATALRRLMLKHTGTTPSQFRPRQR